MPSSKYPGEFLPVPKELIFLSAQHPEVHCNLRLRQRQPLENKYDQEEVEAKWIMRWTGEYAAPIGPFLRTLRPGTKILFCFQGADREMGTAVATVKRVTWCSEDYPRIDLVRRPERMEEVMGCTNFWSGFVLAIARVSDRTPEFCTPHQAVSAFSRMFHRCGIVQPI